jgi:hypothetical protein
VLISLGVLLEDFALVAADILVAAGIRAGCAK